jgi:predicted kinase
MLVVMTGLPGTGKSAIAEGVARATGAAVFSVDPIEAVLLRAGIDRDRYSDRIAYDLAGLLAETQVQLGLPAVIDAVNQFVWVRQRWRDMATRLGVRAPMLECTCSDVALHRQRVASRSRGIEGFHYEPTWSEVEQRAQEYESCDDEDRLVLDAVEPVDANIQRAIAYARTFGA